MRVTCDREWRTPDIRRRSGRRDRPSDGVQIGQLDEEFVWERLVGDAFTLGAQSWQVKRITHNDVLVVPARGAAAAMSPFWRADAEDRGFPLCQEIGAFLEKADGRLAGSGDGP